MEYRLFIILMVCAIYRSLCLALPNFEEESDTHRTDGTKVNSFGRPGNQSLSGVNVKIQTSSEYFDISQSGDLSLSNNIERKPIYILAKTESHLIFTRVPLHQIFRILYAGSIRYLNTSYIILTFRIDH